jgi:hypothetical protein
MAPKDPDGATEFYSSISEEDFAGLSAEGKLYPSEITPQIAGQWLFNVKAFTEKTVKSNPSNPTSTNPPLGTRTEDHICEEDLRSNPQLNFYEPDAEKQHLKVSINNNLRYSGDGSSSTFLESFFFVKRLNSWYVGIGNYVTEEGAEVEISADLNQLLIKFTYSAGSNSSGLDDGTIIDKTYEITETFY